ncbi:MAG: GGDEF domain-containing protein [Anaerolineales bacterium]
MVTSTFAELGDKFFRYKRQTYLFAFPVGIAICIMYVTGALGHSKLGIYIADGLIVQLSIFILLLIFRPHLMRLIEYIFYFSFATSFFALTQVSISAYQLQDGLLPSELADVLNSLSMWLIVFILAAYLTTERKFLRILIIYIFAGMTVLATNNFWFLASAGILNFSYIFRWINAFSSISMATLLVQRMGVLQQNYASTDMLTGLLNRRALYQILTMEVERFIRYGRRFSIIIFDVDHFKGINDEFGHMKGDEVLSDLAKLVEKTIRHVDYAGRWGGEEFLVILPDTELQAARILAERLCEAVRKGCDGKAYHVTASFGVAAYQEGQHLEEMLHAADNAMYRAKQNGRDQVALSNSSSSLEVGQLE